MVIARGFEPIIRVSLGVVSRSRSWRRGLSSSVYCHAALIIGAAVTALILQAAGKTPVPGEPTYLSSASLPQYWTSITLPSMLASIGGAIGGTLLIAANRPSLPAVP